MRHDEIQGFLNAAGWGDATRQNLAGDASARRYERLFLGDTSAVLMDAPPQSGEDVGPFVALSHYLSNLGLSAPRIMAEDQDKGLLLIEDLGDDLFARLCARKPDCETALYRAAVTLLVQLHGIPALPEVPPYDRATYRRESDLVWEWYLENAEDAVIAHFQNALDHALDQLSTPGNVLVLRDYHAENLLYLGTRSGHAKVGLLDYQDALIGHPAYDLVSLLEDARRDTSETLQGEMIRLYLRLSDFDPDAFRRDYAILGAQRNLKIIGIFARLALRDNKPRYLDLIPRVMAHLQRDLAHPALSELHKWVADYLPDPDATYIAKMRERM